MDNSEDFNNAALRRPPWLETQDTAPSIQLSTRITYGSNYPYPNMREGHLSKLMVCKRIEKVLSQEKSWDEAVFFYPESETNLALLMNEKQLLPDAILSGKEDLAAAFTKDFRMLCLLNHRTHIRFQYWHKGLPALNELEICRQRFAPLIDEETTKEETPDDPNSSDVKIYIETALHLPALLLSGNEQTAQNASEELGFKLYPFMMRKKKALSALHMLALPVNPKLSPEEIIEKTKNAAEYLTETELLLRKRLRKFHSKQLYSKIQQACDFMKMYHEKGLPMNVAMHGLSLLWFAAELDMMPSLTVEQIKHAMSMCGSLSLQVMYKNKRTDPDIQRGFFIRELLNSGNSEVPGQS